MKTNKLISAAFCVFFADNSESFGGTLLTRNVTFDPLQIDK